MLTPKIAIVGAHTGTKFKAPYGDSAWEIWSCSPHNENELLRVDVWFELHSFDLPRWPKVEYLDWLVSLPVVYTQAVPKEIPGAVLYPKDEILERFGRFFFEEDRGSSTAWMMALAITKKPSTIGIWGVHGVGNAAFAAQRYGMRHFMQVACREGIEIICPTPLNAPGKLYAFDEEIIE